MFLACDNLAGRTLLLGKMLRRLLFAYTFMMAYGITAGFVSLERVHPVYGFFLLLLGGVVTAVMPCDGAPIPERRVRLRLFAFALIGSLSFSVKYVMYNGPADLDETVLEGQVVDVEDKGDYLGLTISDDEKYRVNLYDDEAVPMIGDRVICHGRMKRPKRQDNPHCFDMGLYLMSCGIRLQFYADSVEVTGRDETIKGRYRRALMERRRLFLDSIKDNAARNFIAGVVFGDKSGLDESTLEEFNGNATGHVLAVSGLHIGFVFALLKRLTRKKKTLTVTFLSIAVVVLYGEMTLWSASTVRAVIVMSMKMMSVFVRKPFDMLTAVSAAAMLLMTCNPYQLFNTGFQMSFLAMLGIAFFTEFLSGLLGDYAGMLLSVQLATAPYTAFVFHRFNALSLFINIPIIFLASVLVPLCIVLLSVTTLTGTCPSAGASLMEALAELVDRANELMYMKGAFSNLISTGGAGPLIAFYCIMMMLGSEWTRVRLLRRDTEVTVKAITVVLIASSLIGASSGQFDRAGVIFVSVGQGDCTHVRDCGSNIIIDGGGSRDYNLGKKLLMPYLLSNDAGHIDAAMVTHTHMDHYKGIEELSRCYPIESLYLPSMYESEESNVRNAGYLDIGDRVRISDNTSVTSLWPAESESVNMDENSDKNEKNMVYMIDYHGIRILVTGDIPAEEELKMVDYYRSSDALRCDILRVAHHGSNGSTTEEFLNAADPDAAVISVGLNNIYGHPGDDCLRRLEERGIPVYRTDINGAVGVKRGLLSALTGAKGYTVVTMM